MNNNIYMNKQRNMCDSELAQIRVREKSDYATYPTHIWSFS